MPTENGIIIVYEVFDPSHRAKSVFCTDQDEAIAYARAVEKQFGKPLRRNATCKPIIEHFVASVSDLVNLLNKYDECDTTPLAEALAAAE